MSEKEKMLSGEIYISADKELSKARSEARDYSQAFNRTTELDGAKRKAILGNLLGELGEKSILFPRVNFDYGSNTYIGKNCFFNFNTTFLDAANITFGDNVLVGPNCSFLTPVHPMHGIERRQLQDEHGNWFTPEYAKPITVGNDVWICGNVVVNGGVTIGDGAVIASGSVVTRDIPANTFAAGNPCRVIREITDEDFMLDDRE